MLIVVKYLNTKQCSARLSPPPVKLSSFIWHKFPPQKGEISLIVAYVCVCKSKKLYDLRYKSNKFRYIPHFLEWVSIKT